MATKDDVRSQFQKVLAAISASMGRVATLIQEEEKCRASYLAASGLGPLGVGAAYLYNNLKCKDEDVINRWKSCLKQAAKYNQQLISTLESSLESQTKAKNWLGLASALQSELQGPLEEKGETSFTAGLTYSISGALKTVTTAVLETATDIVKETGKIAADGVLGPLLKSPIFWLGVTGLLGYGAWTFRGPIAAMMESKIRKGMKK